VPGTLEALGLGYDDLSRRNFRVVVLSISGFGQTGPYRNRRAFGRTSEAFSGMAYVTGYPDRPPLHSGFPVSDYVAAVTGAFAVLAAIHERDHGSGEGQHIDLALYEATFRLLEHAPVMYDRLGLVTERIGSAHAHVAPVGTYRTADGAWISYTGSTDDMVRRLFRAMGHEALIDDDRFSDAKSRVANREELDQLVS
jgi:crotonobetainyl-CoA:carnitine CoA-transferase CaiB-like acyl-CoA transferase